jgi:sulfite exporter TauE/SafE
MTKRATATTKRTERAKASCDCHADNRDVLKNALEACAMLLAASALYFLYTRIGSPSFALEEGSVVSLGTIFLVGVTASVSSCLALVGGLLLSVSAAWCEGRENLSHTAKFVPLALFNIGRLAGYLVLGGVIGMIGQNVGLSLKTTGMITVLLALVMLALGLKILHIIPKSFCTIPLPKSILQRIRGLSKSNHPFAAVLLGALTFFIPCGFTQSVQLLALGSGSFLSGAVIMFAFALGTLPALLGISALSAFAEGTFGRLFFKFSGAVVVLLAFVNLSNGLVLSGHYPMQFFSGNSGAAYASSDPNVTIDENGQQIISLQVSDHGYSPASFTIDPDKPTWVYAVAQEGVSGCATQLTAPEFNMSVSIKQGENWMGPMTPKKDFVLACSMGMYRADVHVKQG